jgi:hypothetical protein
VGQDALGLATHEPGPLSMAPGQADTFAIIGMGVTDSAGGFLENPGNHLDDTIVNHPYFL